MATAKSKAATAIRKEQKTKQIFLSDFLFFTPRSLRQDRGRKDTMTVQYCDGAKGFVYGGGGDNCPILNGGFGCTRYSLPARCRPASQ